MGVSRPSFLAATVTFCQNFDSLLFGYCLVVCSWMLTYLSVVWGMKFHGITLFLKEVVVLQGVHHGDMIV